MHLQRTILNALRVALGIFSGIIILYFVVLENLRIFQNDFFTREDFFGIALRLSLHKGADLLFHVLHFLVEHPGGNAQCAVAKDNDLLHAV